MTTRKALIKASISTLLAMAAVCALLWFVGCYANGDEWPKTVLCVLGCAAVLAYVFGAFYMHFKGQ